MLLLLPGKDPWEKPKYPGETEYSGKDRSIQGKYQNL